MSSSDRPPIPRPIWAVLLLAAEGLRAQWLPRGPAHRKPTRHPDTTAMFETAWVPRDVHTAQQVWYQ